LKGGKIVVGKEKGEKMAKGKEYARNHIRYSIKDNSKR